jgi:alkaline phosphatase D
VVYGASKGPSLGALSVTSDSQRFNTLHIEIPQLEPGTAYWAILRSAGEPVCDTLFFETQVLWDFRMDPPPFKLMTGSCAYVNETAYDRPGKAYGGEYQIFETMAAENADLMLWLGDNVYLREVDFGSLSAYGHRYGHMRSLPELQNLLASCPHIAVWDDHDFGPNDCDGSWIHRDWAQTAFESFWINPSYGIPGAGEGIATQYRFNDIDFFLLDNRTFRINHDVKTLSPQILGEEQMDWLIASLKNSRAPFKLVVIGGQMLSDAAIYENFAQFPAERKALLDRIEAEGIKGVVFITGDRHNSELTALQLPNGRWLYDLTASPLTSSAYDHTDEPNTLRVPETMVGERNYATLEFSGPRKDRSMRIRIHDVNGAVLWEKSISATSL